MPQVDILFIHADGPSLDLNLLTSRKFCMRKPMLGRAGPGPTVIAAHERRGVFAIRALSRSSHFLGYGDHSSRADGARVLSTSHLFARPICLRCRSWFVGLNTALFGKRRPGKATVLLVFGRGIAALGKPSRLVSFSGSLMVAPFCVSRWPCGIRKPGRAQGHMGLRWFVFVI